MPQTRHKGKTCSSDVSRDKGQFAVKAYCLNRKIEYCLTVLLLMGSYSTPALCFTAIWSRCCYYCCSEAALRLTISMYRYFFGIT